MKRVLIAEDEFITAEYFQSVLSDKKHQIAGVCHTAKEAVELAFREKPDVIFMDISMEYKTAGINACSEIKARMPNVKIYLLTAYPKEIFARELAKTVYDGYIDKTSFEIFVTENL